MAESIRTVIVRPNESRSVKSVVVSQGVKGDKGDPGLQGLQGEQGLQGPPGPLRELSTEVVTLSITNIEEKCFTLSAIPDTPEKIELTPIGGVLQVYGVDFVYQDGVISWDGLGLDGFLENEEQVLIKY